MNPVTIIGTIDGSITYADRPTVKVVIRNDDKILLLNNGLLPGGGIDAAESDLEAISRELQEELGATVTDIYKIGEVIQYRNLLRKRYVIKGYAAKLDSIGGQTDPQDVGESLFTQNWLPLSEALEVVARSIETVRSKPMDDDANQGKLYNLMTSYELLKSLE